MHRILLDMDPGVDDAMAIVYLCRSPGVELLGLGSVHGNCEAQQAALNGKALLEAAACGHVPVAVGAAVPLVQPLSTAAWVHGQDGLGGLSRAPQGALSPEHAAQQLCRLAQQHPGELEILATGPLTNLALALRLDPQLPGRVKQVMIMGGAYGREGGNISAVAEANFGHDPEAAAIVLAADWPITVVGLDVTMSCTLELDHLKSLEQSSDPTSRWLSAILGHYVGVYKEIFSRTACPMHDPLAAAALLRPDLVAGQRWPVQIELGGQWTRGMMVCDRRAHVYEKNNPHLVQVITEVDVDGVRQELLSRIAP